MSQKSALISLLQDRPIAYHPALAKILGGVKQAIFVSQLLYWTDKGKRPDGYIWKTQDEWEEETGLSPNEQRTARKHLVESGILLEKLKSIPAMLHYKLDLEKLQASIEDHYNQDVHDPNILEPTIQPTIPETTPEITADISAHADTHTDEEKEPPTVEQKTWTHADIQHIEMVDAEDREHECENCDKPFDVYTLSGSAAQCSCCGRPIKVSDWQGLAFRLPPQSVRHKPKKNTLGDWSGKVLKAFCVVSTEYEYGALTAKMRVQWAGKLKSIAETAGATSEQTYEALRNFRSENSWMTKIGTPHNPVFARELQAMLIPKGKQSPPVIKLYSEEKKVIRVS